MGDIEKEEYEGPKIYANLDECWEDLISKENVKNVFPDPLRPRETLIFMLGVIAGVRAERGEWISRKP